MINSKTKKYVDKKIEETVEKKLKSNFKKEIFLVILSVLLTGIVTYLITYSSIEKYADISTAYSIDNESVTMIFHNDAKISASEIRIIGIINGEEKILTVIRDKVLSNKDNIIFELPITKVERTILLNEMATITPQVNQSPKIFGGFAIPYGETYPYTILLYRIECDRCRNSKSDWKQIIPEKIEYTTMVKNVKGDLYATVKLKQPQWVVIQ